MAGKRFDPGKEIPWAGLTQARSLAVGARRANMIDSVKEDAMPDHIRMILKHALVGFGISVAFTVMILAFNIGNLWHLVTHTTEGPIAVLMLVVFGTITFGSAQIGYKIMTMGEEDDEQGGGKRDALPVADPVAIPVRTTDR